MINCTAQWVSNGPYGTPGSSVIYSMLVNDSGVFAGTHTGLFITTNNGGTWALTNLDSTAPVFSLVASGATIYAGAGSDIVSSPDNGLTWSVLDTGITQGIGALAISGSNIFAGTRNAGILMSANGGQTWAPANNGLPANVEIRSLLVNGSTIFAGTGSYGVYASTNNGANWTADTTGLPVYPFVDGLAVKGSDIYACVLGGYGTGSGMYVSSDNGATWTISDLNLADDNLYVFSVTASDSGVFAITDKGLYRSTNGPLNWLPVPTAIGTPYLSQVAISSSTIFVGTDTNYVWQRPLFGISIPSTQLVASVITYPAAACTATDSVTIEASRGVPPYTAYATTGAANYPITGTFDSVATLTGLATGNYTIIVKDNANDSVAIQVTLNGPASPIRLGIYYSGDTVCTGQPVTVTTNVTGGAPPYTYLWTIDSVNTLYGNITSIVDSIVRSGSITLVVTDTLGCSATANFAVMACTPNTSCSAQFTLYPDTSAANSYYALNQATGTGPLTYLWNWGDDSTSTGITPSHTYADSGYYTICLTITDSTGCTSTYCDSNAYLRSTQNLVITVNVVTSLPTGIPIVENTSSVSIYPNPATTQLLIKTSNFQPQYLTIYDMDGRVVTRQRFTPQLDISTLAAGLYFIELGNETVTERKRFVKL